MNICILTHTFPRFRGDTAAPFMDGVASGIAKAGNKVFVLTPFSDKFIKDKQDYQLVTYKYIYPNFLHKLGYSETLSDDKELKLIAMLLSPFLIIFGIINLFGLVKKEKIDVVNAHWILPNGFIAGVVALFTGVKVVSTLPGSDVHMAFKNPLFSIMARFAADKSQVITSNSGQLLKDLSRLGINEEKQTTVTYGVDPKQFYPNKKNNISLKKKYGISSSEILIIGAGRLVEKKGFQYLISAIKKVLYVNKKIHLLIVGDGDLRHKLEKQVRDLKIENHVIFVGTINYEELVNYYNLADIFVLPSIRDSQGNLDDQSVMVVEAMCCNTATITTDFPGYKLVITSGENGLLVKEKDVTGLTNAILKLVNDDDLRKKIGKEGRKEVIKNHSWQAIGEKYTRIFKAIR